MFKKVKKYVADFETTVFDGQEFTEVWAAGLCEIGTEDAQIFNSFDKFFKQGLLKTKGDIDVYFHNLAFDGSFILNNLITGGKWKPALEKIGVNSNGDVEQFFVDMKNMNNGEYRYTISDRGQWYNITLRHNSRYIRIYDSFKLLPFSLRDIGKAFKTKHQKLEMEYVGYRQANGFISESEEQYLKNDLFVIAEALDIMFQQGHSKKTIGSCCLSEYKSIITESFYKEYFPDLRLFNTPPELVLSCKEATADGFIRRAYKGGWCYLVKGKEDRVYQKGITADVNSLYPSVMHSESGNRYPVGKPQFWIGDIPDIVKNSNGYYYYYIRIRTEFQLKENYLPCIQIKNNPFYKPTEWLETSEIYNKKTGTYVNSYLDENGKYQIATVDLTLTCTDFQLIQEHYELYNLEILGGCYFATELGMFDDYINKWRKIKETTTGAERTLAKLFLNNLYGKLASNDDSSFKIAYLDNGVLKFNFQEAHEKDVVSIACGAAVTSYAREFTIRHAQKNYYGKDKRGFIYADTDSIHCDLSANELIDIDVHPTKFLHWKLESTWDKAIFVRQKTYIEHVIENDLEPVEKPYNSITCAGMGKRCKELLNASIEGEEIAVRNEDERRFVSQKRTYQDFKKGLIIPSKLVAKNIKGGVLLTETTFEMH